jgi:hypothetical protein
MAFVSAKDGFVGGWMTRRSWRTKGKEHTPGAKALSVRLFERPKAKALGYLDAKATATATAKATIKDNNNSKGLVWQQRLF